MKYNRLNNLSFHSISGFTLIELIAVISIISLMLFFSIPRLDSNRSYGDLKDAARWVLVSIPQLKDKATSEQKPYALRVSFEKNSFAVMDDTSRDQDIETTPVKTYLLPLGVRVTDVEFPVKGVISTGEVDIRFYDKGYSDKALLHLRDEEGNTHTLLIEPFLPAAKLYEEYKSFF